MNSALGGFQNFYYSVGAGTPTPIQSGIGVLSTPVITIAGDTASLNTTYGNGSNPFSLQAVYILTGGPVGSPNSDLTEDIDVKNNQATALTFHFFQYANFTVPSPSVSLQTQLYQNTPLYTLAQVAGGSIALTEYIDGTLNPGAEEGTITPPTVTALTTTAGFGLPGPAVNTSGPGGAWLLEWDVTIPVNGTFILSKDYLRNRAPAGAGAGRRLSAFPRFAWFRSIQAVSQVFCLRMRKCLFQARRLFSVQSSR